MLFDLYQSSSRRISAHLFAGFLPGLSENRVPSHSTVCWCLLSEYHHLGHPLFSDPPKHHIVDDYVLHQITVYPIIFKPQLYPHLSYIVQSVFQTHLKITYGFNWLYVHYTPQIPAYVTSAIHVLEYILSWGNTP